MAEVVVRCIQCRTSDFPVKSSLPAYEAGYCLAVDILLENSPS